jgi:hypothetical protein
MAGILPQAGFNCYTIVTTPSGGIVMLKAGFLTAFEMAQMENAVRYHFRP